VISTDTRRDGALAGPNLASLGRATEITDIPLIASGGVGRNAGRVLIEHDGQLVIPWLRSDGNQKVDLRRLAVGINTVGSVGWRSNVVCCFMSSTWWWMCVFSSFASDPVGISHAVRNDTMRITLLLTNGQG